MSVPALMASSRTFSLAFDVIAILTSSSTWACISSAESSSWLGLKSPLRILPIARSASFCTLASRFRIFPSASFFFGSPYDRTWCLCEGSNSVVRLRVFPWESVSVSTRMWKVQGALPSSFEFQRHW